MTTESCLTNLDTDTSLEYLVFVKTLGVTDDNRELSQKLGY